eukprot:COSAG03_NODE_27393_length_253_cov_0.980519_1_plen_26_part_10
MEVVVVLALCALVAPERESDSQRVRD